MLQLPLVRWLRNLSLQLVDTIKADKKTQLDNISKMDRPRLEGRGRKPTTKAKGKGKGNQNTTRKVVSNNSRPLAKDGTPTPTCRSGRTQTPILGGTTTTTNAIATMAIKKQRMASWRKARTVPQLSSVARCLEEVMRHAPLIDWQYIAALPALTKHLGVYNHDAKSVFLFLLIVLGSFFGLSPG